MTNTRKGVALAVAVGALVCLTAAKCEKGATTGPPSHADDPGNGADCGAANECRDESGEGYVFQVDVTMLPRHDAISVKISTDENGKAVSIERRTPVHLVRRIAKRERTIQLLVTPVAPDGKPFFAPGFGGVQCKITKYGGADDGALLDWVRDGGTIREIQCIKPAGR